VGNGRTQYFDNRTCNIEKSMGGGVGRKVLFVVNRGG
jgi:hypothetical protein